jgi:hypothetical protein
VAVVLFGYLVDVMLDDEPGADHLNIDRHGTGVVGDGVSGGLVVRRRAPLVFEASRRAGDRLMTWVPREPSLNHQAQAQLFGSAVGETPLLELAWLPPMR